jgi:hypothetical protein
LSAARYVFRETATLKYTHTVFAYINTIEN